MSPLTNGFFFHSQAVTTKFPSPKKKIFQISLLKDLCWRAHEISLSPVLFSFLGTPWLGRARVKTKAIKKFMNCLSLESEYHFSCGNFS